jgi:hypothetical protein
MMRMTCAAGARRESRSVEASDVQLDWGRDRRGEPDWLIGEADVGHFLWVVCRPSLALV